jgi:hypothetical protein
VVLDQIQYVGGGDSSIRSPFLSKTFELLWLGHRSRIRYASLRHFAARFSRRKATTLVIESLAASGSHLTCPLMPMAAGSI